MSEFLAEARILVRPDTTRFRAELVAAVNLASKGVTAPVQVVPVAAGAGLGLLASQATAAAATQSQLAGATNTKAAADRLAAREAAAHARQLNAVQTAAIASGASFLGLRGAVLTASAAFLGATVAIQATIAAVRSAAELQSTLNVLAVTTRATANEMERVRAEAVALGRDISLPAVTAKDAADAMLELSRAGLSVEDSISGARGVLQLASAAQLDNAAATEIAASALNAFNLAGSDTVEVADLLANAANEAQGGIGDIGIAMQQASAAANVAGVSLEDTVAIITLLARAGIRGSDAGTSLRVALLRLINPPKEAKKALEALNVQVRDLDGNIRPEVFFDLQTALQGVSRAQREATLATIFGVDGFRVAAVVGRESQASFDELGLALDREGAAAELAAARNVGLTGELSALQSNVETLGTTLGEFAIPFLSDTAGVLSEVATAFGEAAEKAREFRDALPGDDGGGLGLFSNLPEVTKEAAAFFDLIASGNALDFGELSAVAAIEKINEDILEASKSAADLGDALKGVQVTSDAVRVIRDLRGELIGSGEAANDARERLEAVERLIVALGRVPTVAEIKFFLDEGFIPDTKQKLLDEFGTTSIPLNLQIGQDSVVFLHRQAQDAGTEAAEAFEVAFGNILTPELAQTLGIDFMSNFGLGAKGEGEKQGPQVAQSFTLSLDTQIAVAEAEGDESALLGALRERERRQAAFLERVLARPQTKANQELATKAANNLAATRRRIEAIEDANARDAEQSADRIAAARARGDEAFIQALTQTREDADFKAAQARTTAGLGDDIRAQDAIQALIRRQIQKIRDEVKGQEAKQAALRALQVALRDSNLIERQLRQQQAAAAAEAAQDRQDARQRALELNLEFAEITGNESAQRRALNAIISALEKRIAAMKGISNKERELRNELARRRKQLNELTNEQQQNNRAAEFFFEQLQAQQGFAANLLGNLIPRDQTAGLVGAPAPVTIGGRIKAEAAAAKGRQGGGPTSGQVNSTNELLLRILNQLKVLTQTTEAPEAIEQRRTAGASLDYAAM